MQENVHASFISKLDYCNVLLYGLPDGIFKILQQVQSYAACIVTHLGRSEHITPVLHDLHWLPLDMQMYTVLFYTFKTLHKCAPPYICELIKLYVASLYMLDVAKIRTKKYGARQFSYAAAIL